MNFTKRKELAARVLGVGKNKIIFDPTRLNDIKEAITKQDIRDFYADGTITIREERGKRKHVKRTTKRGPGKIKLRVQHKKRKYIILTRKLRRYIKELKNNGKMDHVKYKELRKKIRAREFKDKAHIKDHIGGKI